LRVYPRQVEGASGVDRTRCSSPQTIRIAWVVLFLTAVVGQRALAQTDNICDAGEAPDILVGEILDGIHYGSVGGISAYSFGTESCNLGTCRANWFEFSSNHPVIGQNMFRLKDGRFEQIGQAWVKHGFAAIDLTTCSPDCLEAPEDEYLGVNCSDPYYAGLNGYQRGLGPKSEVRAWTGVFPWPPTDLDLSGDTIYKRLQVHDVDLDPVLNPGAAYFVEAQDVARDDALAGNQYNNASYRPVIIDPSLDATVTGGTARGIPAIFAWQDADPQVRITAVDLSGRYYVGARVTDLGNGTWHYEYAVQNLNADGAGGFTVPVNGGSSVSSVGFHDVDYHSGEPYDGTDWTGAFDAQAGGVSWNVAVPDDFGNALRWGTLYNFRFDCDRPPEMGTVILRPFFVEQSIAAAVDATVDTWVPLACDDDGICEPAENCDNCPGDCADVPTISFCGDGVCNPAGGENCSSCGQDCNGQGGSPDVRFCCGDGGGQNPVDCSDPRCTTGGFVCNAPCCGDGVCNLGETRCTCAPDCGPPATAEIACDDGDDDDCDGLVDCGDLDCCTDALCIDGIDSDGDSVADCDCDDTNPDAWFPPGEALDLTLGQDSPTGLTLIAWSPPVDPGATNPSYAILRSASGSDFVAGAQCLSLADPFATGATDGDVPLSDALFHYLVRAENACPAAEGLGPLGVDSTGSPRRGQACP